MGVLDSPSVSPKSLAAARQADLSADWARVDLFDRPDGPFVTGLLLPTGQKWLVTNDVAGSVPGPQLQTKSKALVYETKTAEPAPNPKAYMWTEKAGPFSRFSVRFSFGAGTTNNGTIGFIWGPKSTVDTGGVIASNGPNGTATNSIHGSIGPNSFSFLMFKAGVMSPVFASSGLDGTWASEVNGAALPLEVDRHYTVSVERLAKDAMRLWLPAPRVGGLPKFLDITDALILSRSGVADKIADLWPSTANTTPLIEFLQPTATRTTDRHARFHGYWVGGGGENYERVSAKDADGGYPGLAAVQGARNGSKFLRDDGTWQTPAGSGGGTAATTTFAPAGTVASTDVQAAIVEAAGEAAQRSANLSDIADAASARNNLGLGRLLVVKSADESVLNSTAVQDDDELNVPIAVDETWVIEWNLRVDGSTTGDVRFVVAAPAGAAGSVSILSQATSATSAFGAQLHQAVALGANVNAGTAGAGTTLPIVIRAVVRNGATAGSVRLQWAQVALDAVVPTRVLADSTLVAHRR